MKAIVYRTAGTADVLELVDREADVPGPGEVRVRVAVSGVNPTDWKFRSGAVGPPQFEEIVPNQDGAGVIDALGPGVEGLDTGDRVWLFLTQHTRPGGTAQEYVVLPAQRVVRLPDGVDLATGASLGVPAMTAHRALTVHGLGPDRLAPGALDGRVVLVAGGAGAVGHAAIQLARWAGATVIATVSSAAKGELARAAGAHHAVDYRAADAKDRILAVAPDGVDHIVEVNLAANHELDLAVAAPHCSIAFYAVLPEDAPPIVLRPLASLNLRVQGVLLYTVGETALRHAAADITAALRDGALPVGEAAGLPLTWFPLPDTGAAHDAVQGGTVGKVLVRIADDAADGG